MKEGKTYRITELCADDPRIYSCRVLEVLSVLKYDEEAYRVWVYQTGQEGVILGADWSAVELSNLEKELL
jgi:hypothetical protein